MSKEIQQKMAFGAGWMVLFSLTERSLGLISMLILVRLLSPTDFGIVAMATSFIFMAELLVRFGFDIALIQRQNATEEDYHTAWTCNLLLGMLITVLMLASANSIAWFYGRPELFWIVCALALGSSISGLENIGVVAFRKDMQFRREFAFQLSRKLIGFLVVVPLAFFLHSYWALVAGTLASRLAGTVTSYLVHSFRPRLTLAKVRSLLGFSKWLLLNNAVCFFKERSSDFVIGRLLGAEPLGLYSISYEVSSMPTTELSAPINRALLPGFARIAHDPVAMRAAYRNAISALALIAVPAAAGIFAIAPFLVPVILGTKWLTAVPLMEILALNGGLLLFHSSICTVLIASGHPDCVTKTNASYVVMLLALLGLLVPFFGVTGAAFSALGASVLATPIYLLQVSGAVGISAGVFARAAARPVVAAVVMVGLVRWTMPDWSAAMTAIESIGWLMGGVASGGMVYAIAVLMLWAGVGRPEGVERVVMERIRQLLAKRSPASPSTPAPDPSIISL
jgi:lipopolysaccharide exporter